MRVSKKGGKVIGHLRIDRERGDSLVSLAGNRKVFRLVTTCAPVVGVEMRGKRNSRIKRQYPRRFDAGEDIDDLIDLSRATVIHHGKKVRITLDIADSLVKEIDEIRQ